MKHSLLFLAAVALVQGCSGKGQREVCLDRCEKKVAACLEDKKVLGESLESCLNPYHDCRDSCPPSTLTKLIS